MSGTSAIDLSRIPFPGIVETLSYEAILAAMVADLQARDPAFTALVESDPAYKILEVAAYRELLLRQRVNDGAKGCMLAYAQGSDLEHLAALYGVERKVLDPGNPSAVPPVPPTYESDADLRRRTQLALEGFSVAGPEAAYVFHALTVDGTKDASATSPTPGDVLVSVLSATGNGAPSPEMLAAVEAVFADEDVRPLTDNVTVQEPDIVNYAITAQLWLYEGPDSAVVLAEAIAAAQAYAAEHHRLGHDITRSALFAALHRAGVQRVVLASPAADIVNGPTQAAYCTAIDVTIAGRDE